MEIKIDDLKLFTLSLAAAFPEYKFDLNYQGAGWARVFVIYHGVSLGRINFQPTDDGKHAVYGVKHYKPYDYEYSKEDSFFYQVGTWIATGKRIEIDHLVEIAKANKLKKIEEHKKWREEHPLKQCVRTDGTIASRGRAKLSTSWKGEFSRLVDEEIRKTLNVGQSSGAHVHWEIDHQSNRDEAQATLSNPGHHVHAAFDIADTGWPQNAQQQK